MSLCYSSGLPHTAKCSRCDELDRRLARARKDPEYVAALAANDAAWAAYWTGRDLPRDEAHALEKAWRAASDQERAAFGRCVARAAFMVSG